MPSGSNIPVSVNLQRWMHPFGRIIEYIKRKVEISMAATIGELYRETVSNDALIKSDQDKLAADMSEAANDNRALLAALQARGKPGFVAYPQGLISVLSLSEDGSQLVVQVFESIEDVPVA